jgi:SsrA-binding protein
MVILNKRAKFDYDIKEEFICGIKLMGSEVKSIREGNVSFSDSYVIVSDGQVYLTGVFIGRYEPSSHNNHEGKRKRVLLLNRREITKLEKSIEMKGTTIVPMSIFTKGSLIKVKIGLGKGKREYDKRNTIKDRDISREVERSLTKK